MPAHAGSGSWLYSQWFLPRAGSIRSNRVYNPDWRAPARCGAH